MSVPPAAFPLGIGIVTYNRRAILSDTIDRVRQFTRHADAMMVVADDGSSDGTLEMLRDRNVPVVTGVNKGIAWNKNRALFVLAQMLRCQTVILLEDDTQPNKAGWETAWMQATQRWGHVNFAADWLREHFLAGTGTVDDPVLSEMITAQCSAYSWDALTFGGYYDSHFVGYGHEHVEHTRRLVRVGYGGTDERIEGKERVRYYSISGDLTVVASDSFYDQAQEQTNLALAQKLMGMPGYRPPWNDDATMRQFRSEIESAMRDGPDRFRMGVGQVAAAPGLFGRLFHRH